MDVIALQKADAECTAKISRRESQIQELEEHLSRLQNVDPASAQEVASQIASSEVKLHDLQVALHDLHERGREIRVALERAVDRLSGRSGSNAPGDSSRRTSKREFERDFRSSETA
jgi:hypothetical protein